MFQAMLGTIRAAQGRLALDFSKTWSTAQPSEPLVRWERSLRENLGHQGDSHVFLVTDLVLGVDGSQQHRRVYQGRANPAQFLVVPNGHHTVLVDRDQEAIGTMGVSGLTLHPDPSGQMVVCLQPSPGDILGMPLSDRGKTAADPPTFTATRVWWTW